MMTADGEPVSLTGGGAARRRARGDGAVFALREDGHHFAVDLNACRRVTSLPDAERLSCAILLLRDGVRAILRARRITH